jgi:signal transduction histidine kinase
MSEIVEKIVFISLGIVSGVVIAIILLSLDIPFIASNPEFICTMLLAIIGLLSAVIILFYKRYKLSKTEFNKRNETIALITHEMRTSLTSTSWAIAYVLKEYEKIISEVDKKMLDGIIKSIHTTVMHTVNLLDTSMLDIGKINISLSWITLEKVEEMIREVVEKYKIGVKKDGIVVTDEISLDYKNEVEVDILRLRIILENLIENSIQYIRDDLKEIDVKVSNTPKALNIEISDSGIGIPEEEKGKIFQEFFRASNARKRLSSGSGIGLHMCEQFVKAQNGSIRFESNSKKGTTFYISIPLKSIADVNAFLKQV